MAAIATLTIACATTLWAIGGTAGFAYFAAFPLLCLPGFPLGFALFGSRHAASWLAALLLGYAIATLAVWSAVYSNHATPVWLVGAWALSCVASSLAVKGLQRPLVTLPDWSRRDSAALCLVLALAPALVARPFNRLGAEDAAGNRQYRAYFIADFVWHTALTAELAKQDPQPRNPFLAAEPVHYYWTYFRVPASIAAETGLRVQTALKLNAFATALLLLAAIFVAAWAAAPTWPMTTAAAVALTVLAPSIEGWAGIADVVWRGLPLSELRDINIDAVAAWAFKGLRIDNLPRTLWYTPQHGFSCALGLLAVPIALRAGARAPLSAVAIVGCALGASVAFNPLLGVVFCAVYGVTIASDVWSSRGSLGDLFRHTVAVVPVAVALGWCTLNQVGEGAGDVIHFGYWGLARNATVLTFLLQFGPLLLPMAAFFLPGPSRDWTPLWPAVIGIVVAVLVMHLVALTVDLAWVGFRGGNIFFVLAPSLVTHGLLRLSSIRSPRWAVALALVVLAAGLPTTLIDAYNAQDVENRGLSRDAERVRGRDILFDRDQEFHWTVVVTRAEQEALDWIRVNTPLTAIVQAEPIVRGRETWSLIPSFAERRMATGNALPLLARPLYDLQNARVRTIYASQDPEPAWRDARALRIDYVYVDQTERGAYPGVAKFDAAPELFRPVFRNAEAVVYALRP